MDEVVTLLGQLKIDKEKDGPPALPDDILEMLRVLARTPFVSLMRTKAVCKKWESSFLNFPFSSAEGAHLLSGALAVPLRASPRWCLSGGNSGFGSNCQQMAHNKGREPLTGRLLYSVTAVSSSIYVVGGCSTNASRGSTRSEKSTVRTLKSVEYVHSPYWVLEEEEFKTRRRTCRVRGNGERSGGTNQRLSEQYREGRFSKHEVPETPWSNSRRDRLSKEQRRFGLIAVGGHGKWTEQLDSAEIYDPLTDRWREIASLPVDHGAPCAGVVCKNAFYVYSQSNKLAAYDLDHEHWRSIRVSQGPPRLLDYAPRLVSCKDRVFLFGVAWGVVADGGHEMASRKIWELCHEPTFVGWVKVSQHPDAPLDRNAIFCCR
ncbi:hypothetical protein R1flu_017212 [Riccia fluitans]|uniref:F-box/kelch-repeat protein n=1 Tax=Riccia fluitans TaxID=41844 RepID=A0ABD1XE20_9MARC